MRKLIIITLIGILLACNPSSAKDPHDKGLVTILPKGRYIVQNAGSRHIVRCFNIVTKDYYWLNDAHFKLNRIPGYDAHQYSQPTAIEIK
jgi:hypothetical protein